jgi:hypothetical protein
MLDVLVPCIIFLVTLLFYVHIRYHRHLSSSTEVLMASSSDDIEEVSRLKMPVVFPAAVQCAQDELSKTLSIMTAGGAILVNSSTGATAPIEGEMTALSRGRHAVALEGYDCPVVSDAGQPPLTVRRKGHCLYMQKGSRSPPCLSLSHRTCICFTAGAGVCELFPPAQSDLGTAIRGGTGRLCMPGDSSTELSTRLRVGDIVVVPPFWGWRIVSTSEASVEVVCYDTVMSWLATIPESVMCDLRPNNGHNLAAVTPAKKRVRWKER